MYLDIRASCKISWKHLFLGFFLVICQTGWRILLFLDCFFTFIWPLKVIKTLFTYFNHRITSITLLNHYMTLIQFGIWTVRWAEGLCSISLKITCNNFQIAVGCQGKDELCPQGRKCYKDRCIRERKCRRASDCPP